MGDTRDDIIKCHVCGNEGLIEFDSYRNLPRVTSDCQKWGSGGTLCVCSNCGCVQRVVNEDWRRQAQKIYEQYEIYAQAGGEEQAVFDASTGQVSRRSTQLLNCLFEDVELPDAGTWLDVGCGNGALLQALSSFVSGWQLTGCEIGDTNRARIESIPNVVAFHNDGLNSIKGTFDVISMVHVLEHIDNPISFLNDIKKHLSPGGYLLIEVPYYVDNPFDLLIADHCTHFAPAELENVLERSGFHVQRCSTECVSKEISLLARQSDEQKNIEFSGKDNTDVKAILNAVKARVDWLVKTREELHLFKKEEQFGIFGTSIAACFADQSSEGRAAYFVDEDVSRIGRLNLGRKIISPKEVPDEGAVYVASPHPLCQKIASRLNSNRNVFVCPPPMD